MSAACRVPLRPDIRDVGNFSAGSLSPEHFNYVMAPPERLHDAMDYLGSMEVIQLSL